MRYLLTLILIIWSGPVVASDPKIETVTYEVIDGKNLEADIWTPPYVKENYPAVITVHGGSWSSRDRNDMDRIARKLSQNGFVVINMSYRLVPKYLFPAQIEDFKSVVKWVKKNATTYKIDINRINAWGYSAGSEISALGALQINDEIPFKSIINGAGPMDLTHSADNEAVQAYLGGNSLDLLKKSSPLFFVKKNSPPVFTYHSTNDHIVGYYHAINFQEKLNKNGVENVLLPIPVLGHILTFLFSHKSIDESIDFLKKHN